MKSSVKKHLIISNTFGPRVGGIEHHLGRLCQTWARLSGDREIKPLTDEKKVLLYKTEEAVDNFKKNEGESGFNFSFPLVLTNPQPNSTNFDKQQVYQIFRKPIDYRGRLVRPRWLVSPVHTLALIKKLKPDLIHAASGLSSYLGAWSAQQAYGLPYLTYIYGLEILAIQKHYPHRVILKKIINQASGLVGCSRFSVNILQSLSNKNKPEHVLYPGVNTDRFKPNLDTTLVRTEYELKSDKRVILSVGRLVARKGFDLTIKALPFILKKFPNTLYVLCGQGPYQSELIKLADELGISQNVKFLGEVSDEDLPYLYNLASLFVMPSRVIKETGDVEGFGLVFLEAASCGLAVIGGDAGGVPEALVDGKTGFLVDSSDENELAKKIILLLENEDLRLKMGRLGRERCLANFQWTIVTSNFLKWLENF